MAKITLPNGVVVEDISDEALKSVLSGMEDGIHYQSNSRGRIKIKDMATPHLKNAILKALRGSLESAKNLDTQGLVKYLRKGVGGENLTLISLVKELGTRQD